MEVLTADQLEAIHLTSLRILEDLGIELRSPRACEIMRAGGAQVDESSGMVRIDRGLVDQALATAPKSFTLTPRNPARQVTFGGNHLNFGLVAGPPNVHDRERGRRSGNLPDYCDFIRLAHYFNAIHLIGNQVCAPVELPANSRHWMPTAPTSVIRIWRFTSRAIGAGRALDGIRMMAIARGITLEEIAASPGVITIISVNSPRRFDEAMSEGLVAMAAHGQPVVITPFTLMGAMAPVSLAAALAQQNAEALFGVVLAQAVRPGDARHVRRFHFERRPAFRCAGLRDTGEREGECCERTAGATLWTALSDLECQRLQRGRRSGRLRDRDVPVGSRSRPREPHLSRGRLAGRRTHGLVREADPRRRDAADHDEFLEAGQVVDEAELGFEAIRGVKTGGHFFGEPHTLERYEHAFYEPLVSNWQNYENWQIAGGKDATQRATGIWKRALAEYEEPVLDPAVAEALDEYMACRRREIGDGEP